MGTLAVVLQILLLFTGLFLMLIILLQRGRGGGLAGAFGGMGGQSAFGTKAGDMFTWITIVTATVWVLLAGISGCVMRQSANEYAQRFGTMEQTTPDLTTPENADAEGAGAATGGDATIPVVPEEEAEDNTAPAEPAAPATESTTDTPDGEKDAGENAPAKPAPDEANAGSAPKAETTPEPMPETPAPKNGSPESSTAPAPKSE